MFQQLGARHGHGYTLPDTTGELSMKYWLLVSLFCLAPAGWGQTQPQTAQPVVVSAQMRGSALIYKLNNRRVEDSRENSLLTNLGTVVRTRGVDVPVFIIIDVRASFAEVGKLETALDKAGLMHRRLFVSDFSDKTMNEIHWDETAIPIPPS
jgi:hypothetical protein